MADTTSLRTESALQFPIRSTPWEQLVRLLHNAELLNGEIFTTLREAQVLIE